MQRMNRRIFLLSILSISFLLFLFLHSHESPPTTLKTTDSYRQATMKPNLTETKLVQNDTESYIFSKNEYFNKTRKVKLFSLSHYIFYYCLTILAF